MPRVRFDAANQKFGKLSTSDKFYKRGKAILWECTCECGNVSHVDSFNLRNNSVISCGCHRNEVTSLRALKYKDGSGRARHIYRQYQINAETRNLQFDITFEQFLEIAEKSCHYCDSPPTSRNTNQQLIRRKVFSYSGVDRWDNTKGYILDNCVPCCKYCNRAKSDMPLDEFYAWQYRISEKLCV